MRYTTEAELERARGALDRVDRAIAAALAVRTALTEMQSALGRAQGWGQRDVWTRGVAASPRKHGELAQARLHQQRLQTLLARHRAELEALGRVDPLIAHITPVEVFQDMAENWLVDWVVQDHIDKSIDRAREFGQKLTAFVTRLAEEGAVLRARCAELEERLVGEG